MFDIWGFLLQTLTASGVAVLLLVIKALFKDNLPPKWHFAVWGALAVVLLIPAGWNGRYTIIHWQYVIELIKGAVKEFGFTRVLFPIPLVSSVPHTLTDWIFTVYFAGVILHLALYLISYIHLRFVLNKGKTAPDSITDRVKEISAGLKVKPCRVIEVRDLPSAFRLLLFIQEISVLKNLRLLSETAQAAEKTTPKAGAAKEPIPAGVLP